MDRSILRPLVTGCTAAACGGCSMLGALAQTSTLRGIVIVVVVVAALGFLVSRAGPRR